MTLYNLLFSLFTSGCAGSSLLHGLFSMQNRERGAALYCGAGASHRGAFSCGAQALGRCVSVAAAHGLRSFGSQALEHRLNSCGSRAWLTHSMWNCPGPGMEPVSSALAGGFFTAEP